VVVVGRAAPPVNDTIALYAPWTLWRAAVSKEDGTFSVKTLPPILPVDVNAAPTYASPLKLPAAPIEKAA
jgi:hypothetical protein